MAVCQSFCCPTLQYIDGGEALSAAVDALVWLYAGVWPAHPCCA